MRRKRIAALMAGVDREYQRAVVRGLVYATKAQDMDLCVFNCQGHPDGVVRNDRGERAIFELPDFSDFDGMVLLMDTIPTPECKQQLLEKVRQHPDMPLVTIDNAIEHSVTITFDDRSSVRNLMNDLIENHGVRTIAIVTGPRRSTVAMDRCDECRKVMQEHDLILDETMVFDGGWVRAGGRQAAEELLASSPYLPDAIVCGNDDMAFGVIERLREAGYSVPLDVKVTGFDALREAEGRGLTSVRRPERETGEQAIALLMDWIEHGRPEVDTVCLPTLNIPGRTCGCEREATKASSYVRILSDEYRAAEKSLLQAAYYFGSLPGVPGREEAAELINAFAESAGMQELHVCVDPDFLSAEFGSIDMTPPKEMLYLSGWNRGQTVRQQMFKTSLLLPQLAAEREQPLAYVFSPLYVLDKNLGYAVFDVDYNAGYAFYGLLTLLSSSLMSLSLQTTVRAYATVLENKSTHDTLTGLHNRLGFEEIVPPIFEQAMQEGKCFALVSCDMDRMKEINDNYGHLNGDKAICRMGKALQVLEEYGMLCVHISGDEFLAAGIVENAQVTDTLLDALRASIDRLNREDSWLCDLHASMGAYAAVPKPGDQLNNFIMYADRRMYMEKKVHHDSK